MGLGGWGYVETARASQRESSTCSSTAHRSPSAALPAWVCIEGKRERTVSAWRWREEALNCVCLSVCL